MNLRIALILVAMVGFVTGQPARGDEASRLRELHEKAIANPANTESVRLFLESLPRVGDYYVLEGDLLLTESEVRVYLEEGSGRPVETGVRPELAVNLIEGRRDYWSELQSRQLSYAVDRSSFPTLDQYKSVVQSMARAASEWEQLCTSCAIRIAHLSEHDAAPSHTNVTFIVRWQDSGGTYIAAGFFPHQPPSRRYLDVDPSFFTSQYNRVGVMRHEVGHVLGYRHEQTRHVRGCRFEDDRWEPLTPYDPHSVMHYFCGGGGGFDLAFSDLDKKGHEDLYGALEQAMFLQSFSAVARYREGTQRFYEDLLTWSLNFRESVLATFEEPAMAMSARRAAPPDGYDGMYDYGRSAGGTVQHRRVPGALWGAQADQAPPPEARLGGWASLQGGDDLWPVSRAGPRSRLVDQQEDWTDLADAEGSGEVGETAQPRRYGDLNVRFEGGEVNSNIARVMHLLWKVDALPLAQHTVAEGEDACSILPPRMGLPQGCSRNLRQLADAINGGSTEILSKGDELSYPLAMIRQYVLEHVFDLRSESQRKEYENLKRYWRPYHLKDEPFGNKMVSSYRAYEMVVPLESEEQAAKAWKTLHPLRSKNVRIAVEPYQMLEDKPLFSYEDPREYWKACELGLDLAPKQACYSKMLGIDGPPQCALSCEGEHCPELILVDQPIYLHPDLGTAVQFGGVPLPRFAMGAPARFASLSKQTVSPSCQARPFDRSIDHGTHLAGIIASQDNSSGFVGLHPGAKIYSYNWQGLSDHSLSNMIADRRSRPALQTYIFASRWGYDVDGDLVEDHELPNPLYRTSHSEAAFAIERTQPLWITAVGQVDAGGAPNRITNTSASAPMNLGDLPNVVVVTACEPCGPEDAHLLASANWSTDLVHLAAPGNLIPSTLASRHYGVASGTSQAAAFVGGMASAMRGCWGYDYIEPEQVKIRLQVTASPVFTGESGERVVSGVLNPELALLDPSKDWLRLAGEREYREVDIEHWCEESLVVRPHAGSSAVVRNGDVRTRDIYRIVRFGREAAGAARRWVVYTQYPWDDDLKHLGEVLRIGPGAWDPEAPLFRTASGEAYTLAKVEDVLLSTRRLTEARPCI